MVDFDLFYHAPFAIRQFSGPSHTEPGRLALFLVIKNRNDWGEPIQLTGRLGADVYGVEAKLSPEGRTLYFSNNRVEPVSYPKSPVAALDSLHAMETWNGPQRKIWQVDLTPILREYGLSISGRQGCPMT